VTRGPPDRRGPGSEPIIATGLPYTTAFLRSGDATIVLLQDRCPLRVADHTLVAHDGAVHSGIVDAIEGRPVVLDGRAL
jgi:hypothetical protein